MSAPISSAPTSYAEVLDYITEHKGYFGYPPAAIQLSGDELNAFLKVIQVDGVITSSYYDDVKVAGVRVICRG